MSGALLLSVDGEDIAVCASGSDIVAEVRHPRKLFRHAGSPWRARRVLRTVAHRLDGHGLTLTLSCRGVAFLMLGAKIRQSRLARFLGIEHVALVSKQRR